MIYRGRDSLIIRVFKTERSSIFSRSLDTIDGVVVSGAFREKDSEGAVETFRGSRSISHGSHGFVEGGCPGGTGRLSSGVRVVVWAWSAGIGAFEKLLNVRFSGELLFFEYPGNYVVVDELRGFAGVNTFLGENF